MIKLLSVQTWNTGPLHTNDRCNCVYHGKPRTGRVESIAKNAKTGNVVVTVETPEGFRAMSLQEMQGLVKV